jgi:hypothetical protein
MVRNPTDDHMRASRTCRLGTPGPARPLVHGLFSEVIAGFERAGATVTYERCGRLTADTKLEPEFARQSRIGRPAAGPLSTAAVAWAVAGRGYVAAVWM